MKLEQIAKALGGTVVGDASLEVGRAVHPSEAETDRDLALAMDAGLVDCLATSPARAAIVREGVEIPEGVVHERVGRRLQALEDHVLVGLLLEEDLDHP